MNTTPETTATILTLNILASDILESNYVTSEDCAITRALARAGRADLMDSGYLKSTETGANLADFDNLSYRTLVTAVLGMYLTKEGGDYCIYLDNKIKPIPIEDFVHTITFEE